MSPFPATVFLLTATLGLSWLRCPNWAKAGRAVCGLPAGVIDDLLAVLVDVLILENACVVIPLVSEAAELVGVPLVNGIAGVANAGICHGATRAPALHPPSLHLPSSVGVELHLAA